MTDTVAQGSARTGLGSALRRRWFEAGVGACTAAVGLFLTLRLTAWPPHEDETLALFIGRKPLDDMLATVLDQRGGAPLHFLFAWAVAHLGGGLGALRAVSAVFAVASIPLVAALAARVAGRREALVATVLAAGSWMLLFHGVYGRMYSLFLATSTLSFLALLDAAGRGGRGRWTLWALAVLLCIATHPYGALVLVAQAVYVLATRARLREAAWAFGAVLVAGIPFWRSDLVLAGRFEIGVGGGGRRLGTPFDVLRYLGDTAGDFVTGEIGLGVAVLALAAVGAVRLWRVRRSGAVLVAAVAGTPAAVLLLARFGDAAAPEPRHLVFALPFFLTAVAAGIVGLATRAGRRATAVTAATVVALVVLEVWWGWGRTAELYRGEPGTRVAARAQAAAWLKETGRDDDVLFGYDPLFLQAWEQGGAVPDHVVPRADSRLALRALERAEPLGRGVWVLDASDTANPLRRLEVPARSPRSAAAFETRAFGPFLVVRTTLPTGDARTYLRRAREVQLVGKSLGIGDAETNLTTVLGASEQLARYERERRAAASASTASR